MRDLVLLGTLLSMPAVADKAKEAATVPTPSAPIDPSTRVDAAQLLPGPTTQTARAPIEERR